MPGPVLPVLANGEHQGGHGAAADVYQVNSASGLKLNEILYQGSATGDSTRDGGISGFLFWEFQVSGVLTGVTKLDISTSLDKLDYILAPLIDVATGLAAPAILVAGRYRFGIATNEPIAFSSSSLLIDRIGGTGLVRVSGSAS